MERHIGDPLNKAFEAYRQASIEKDTARKELQQKTEYYERYIKQLKQKIEEQNQQILRLEAQLCSALRHVSGENCYETALRKQEVEALSPSDHYPDNTSSCSQRKKLERAETAELGPRVFPGAGDAESEDVLNTLKGLQGTFQLIQKLTRKQNDHLRKICPRSDASNEPQFSMPIQCTDSTTEQAEGPFPPSLRPEVLGDELPSSSLASHGTHPEDGDFGDSLIPLNVKFPPSADSEYEFLNSTPEKAPEPSVGQKGLAAVSVVTAPAEDESFLYPMTSPLATPSASASASLALEGVRGPQQPLWSPELTEAAPLVPCPDPRQGQNTGNCAFCNTAVPQANMYSHLNSHFQNKTSNGH